MLQVTERKLRWLALLASVVLTACSAAPPASGGNTGAPVVEPITTTLQSANSVPTGLLPPEPPPFSTTEWKTDFTRRTVPWNQILSGGPPKDGILALDQPEFEGITPARTWLSERDPVIVFEHEGDARAYPLAILIWHEIVNDVVGGKPVAVTFCPLCNASIVFDRTLNSQVLDFGTTGRLRNSDLVMYDRQTESWWQQFTGEGLVGDYAGAELTFLGGQVHSWRSRCLWAWAMPIPAIRAAAVRSYTHPHPLQVPSGSPLLHPLQAGLLLAPPTAQSACWKGLQSSLIPSPSSSSGPGSVARLFLFLATRKRLPMD